MGSLRPLEPQLQAHKPQASAAPAQPRLPSIMSVFQFKRKRFKPAEESEDSSDSDVDDDVFASAMERARRPRGEIAGLRRRRGE